MGVYSILGTTEDGGCVVLTLIPCAVAANKKIEVGSGPPFANAASYLLLWGHSGTELCESRGHSFEASPPCSHHPPKFPPRGKLSRSVLHSDKPRKVTVAGTHPGSLFTAGRQCSISGMSRMPRGFMWSALGFCQHLMTQFLPDSTKKSDDIYKKRCHVLRRG